MDSAPRPAPVAVRIPDVRPAVEVGPETGPPDDTTASDRSRRDLDILEGKADASALPVVATDPSTAFDPTLRGRLAPTMTATSPGRPHSPYRPQRPRLRRSRRVASTILLAHQDRPSTSGTELFDLVWTTSMPKLAARFGVSDVALAKTSAKFLTASRPYWSGFAELDELLLLLGERVGEALGHDAPEEAYFQRATLLRPRIATRDLARRRGHAPGPMKTTASARPVLPAISRCARPTPSPARGQTVGGLPSRA